jgi:hypothetical protein
MAIALPRIDVAREFLDELLRVSASEDAERIYANCF